MSDTRKPQTNSAPEPAESVLNKFLTENNILLGTERPQVDFTQNGQMVVSSPRIFAVYKTQVADKPNKAVN